MDQKEKRRVLELKEKGLSFGEIAKMMNLPKNTVAMFVSSYKEKGNVMVHHCLCCNHPFEVIERYKFKKFCSDKRRKLY